MFILCGRKFRLLRTGLVRAGCPNELSGLRANRLARTLVITENRHRLGYISATGYWPKGVIVSGRLYRDRLLEAGLTRAWAYVEASVSKEVNSDDEIHCHDLMIKLASLLTTRIYGASVLVAGQWQPQIMEVYPFENSFTYEMRGQKHRQEYAFDPTDRRVELVGPSMAVPNKAISMGEAKEQMPRSETGARYAFAPPAAQLQSYTMGGATSELITQTVRNWKNIVEAANMYLDYLRNSRNTSPMAPSFQPALLKPAKGAKWATEILAALAKRGIDPFQFSVWSAMAQEMAATKKTKSHSGVEVPMSEHAYVGDPNDPSTWKLPIQNEEHVRNALARVNQTQGIPSTAKAAVLKKIRRKAAHMGVDVSDKPTSKQKTWMKKKHKNVNSTFLPGQIPSAGVSRVGVV